MCSINEPVFCNEPVFALRLLYWNLPMPLTTDMPLTADLIVDRRRLRASLTRWRVIGIAAALVSVMALAALLAGRSQIGHMVGQAHIARISIAGFIAYDRPLLRLLERVAENEHIKAVILQIDSPGGSTAGSEALYAAIRRVAEKKPVVGVIGTVGASGAYVAALASDHIIASQTSLVGSIGVLIQWTEFDKLMQTVGVRMQEIKTSPLKAAPNGFDPASPEVKAALQAAVDDTFNWFKDLVKTRRALDAQALARVTDGRIFTGNQAIALKLMDEIGDEKSAVAWLETEKKIEKSIKLHDYKPKREDVPSFLGVTAAHLAQAVGLPTSWLSQPVDAHRLDGLVSVWHPAFSANSVGAPVSTLP